ncbi:type II toxin-antitoxin system RelE family toxin [Algoriphagus boritolerans]|uniref:type II toxin-antitoxin system RelE family toxin n=1 Tax=Algoriphagus boritolerans TaxID=308111 RepID=UPI003898F501
MYNLAENPRPIGYKKLKGRDAYRIRVLDYRIIYELEDSILTIELIVIGYRKDIYE